MIINDNYFHSILLWFTKFILSLRKISRVRETCICIYLWHRFTIKTSFIYSAIKKQNLNLFISLWIEIENQILLVLLYCIRYSNYIRCLLFYFLCHMKFEKKKIYSDERRETNVNRLEERRNSIYRFRLILFHAEKPVSCTKKVK